MAHDELLTLARHYDTLAQHYDRMLDRFERRLLGDWRARAAHQAYGWTLEIAIGTGRTIPLYAERATVIGLELSSGMLAHAKRRLATARVPVFLIRGDAQRLPIRNDSIDVVISILSLCTIPDDRRALAEAYRVLRPGGKLLLVEHVRSPNGLVRAVQHLLDPLSVRFAHDHLLRDPLDHLQEIGFRVLDVERRALGIVERVLAEKPAT
ncbi:class I SAM-dependent methyltransferase [Thermomicrobium sp. 4228-Ro]|uniref:class I SAM-dependent methyltransferase n=1 Tax=Thermomicrobium sp. 4228-Ro TaxID=2993937 RepID=UPI0022489DB4|nr:class I SAM-dependent methyltransferase [Thermomicrobium sp. 4228-Ro]MCX2726344.1 class I SAM-dependent methyltransferase [Thermomicrobium sp. 4228-Ro]